MKIGLLNCQHIDNFGALLVAYSLQNAINSIGDYEVEIINYQPKKSINEKKTLVEKKDISYYISRIKQIGIKAIIKEKYVYLKYRPNLNPKYLDKEKYERWRRVNLNRSETVYGEDTPIIEYDLIIEGSDVVWKPERLLGSEVSVFLLKNADKKTLCATYAASVGTDNEQKLESIKEVLKEGLDKYISISVREKSLRDYISGFYSNNIEINMDPTFLLDKEDYESLIDKSEDREYIFFYCMGINEEAIKFTNHMSKKLNCGVVHPNIYYINKKIKRRLRTYENDDPSQFLSLVANAKLVVTNSFHGTVFSLIFHVPFYTFGRGDINARMKDLLEMFGLKDRFLKRAIDKSKEYNRLDFSLTDKLTMKEKHRGYEYLRKVIEDANIRILS